MDDSQKSKILEIYNNPNVHKDDKRNAINAIINGERIITAKPVKTDDKSISRKKRKHGGKKSNKSKKYIKSPESHSKKRKQNSIKKTSKSTKRNESPTKNHDYDDKFFAEMEQLYQDLNAIELTKIIKELTEQINEKIKKE